MMTNDDRTRDERYILLSIDEQMNTTLWLASASGDVSENSLEAMRESARAGDASSAFKDSEEVIIVRLVEIVRPPKVIVD